MAGIDPPHDYLNSCNVCHNSTALLNAANLTGSIDNTPINVACRSCHYTNGSATPKLTHSSTNSKTKAYGDWTYDCTACHNPHYQRMNRAYSGTGTYPNGPKLMYGVLTSNSIGNQITLSNIPSGTVNALRGYTIVPNTRYGGYAYRIVANNGATINTERSIYSYYAKTGASYAIYYGNLMLDSIDRGKPITNSSGIALDPNSRYATIKLFNSTGPKSSVYNGDILDPMTTAICINCHTKTPVNNIGYVKYSVSFDRYEVVNSGSMTSHATSASSTCWETPDNCHNPPAQGFSRSAAACGTCHGTTMTGDTSLVKKIKIFGNLISNSTGILNVGAHPKHQDRYTQTACDYCHFTGMKPAEVDLASGSSNSVGDYNTTMWFNMASASSPSIKYSTGLYNGFKSVANGGIYNNSFSYNGPGAGTRDSTNLCSNVYCHGATMPTNGGTNYKPNWYQASTGSCGTCHAATSANPPRLGSHIKHTGLTNSLVFAAQACSACHPHDGSGSLHVNGDVDWALPTGLYNGNAGGAVSSVPSEVFSDCTMLYCHSNADPVGPAAADYKPVSWGGAAMNCGSCHSQPSTATPDWSTAHTKHVKAYSVTINCSDCHLSVANNNTTINTANRALHVDGIKNVLINTTDHGATASYSGGTCTQVNCHGTGVRLDTGTNANTPAAWNSSLGCDGCHKASATTAVMTTGNVMSSAHVKHVATDEYGSRGVKAIDCKSCHKGTAASGSVINSAVLHVNFSKNVSFDTTWTLDNPTWTSPNCTSYCHSTGTATPVLYTAVWTNPASGACGTCHSVTKAAFYNASTKHQAHINTTYYNYDCSTCHSGVVSAAVNSSVQPSVLDKTAHVDKTPTVVFNALAAKTGSSWTTPNCTVYCHSTGKNVASANLPPSYSSSNFTTVNWTTGGAMSCNSCHGKTNSSGRPDYETEGSGSAGANSHQMFDTPSWSHGNAKCVVCHALTVNITNTVIVNSVHVDGNIDVSFDAGISVGAWTAGDKKCSNLECHPSESGYTHSASAQWGIAGGCTTCHGQPPAAFATMLNGTYKTGRGYSGFVSNGVGKHTYHKDTKGYTCDTCHRGGQVGGGSHLTTPPRLDIGFNISGNYNGTYNAPAFTGGSTIIVGNSPTTYNQTGTTRLCSNIYCHSDGGNYTLTTFVYQTADWDGAAYSTACNQCHGNATRRAITTLHPVHENTYGYECSICHRDTVSVGNTLIGAIGNHVDFEKDVVFDAANGLTTGASWAKPTCTTYCHTKGTHASNFNAPNAPNYTAQWNSTLPANCVGCHSGAVGASATMNTVTHLTHINNATYVGWNIGCQECHRATVSGNTTVFAFANHVNKLVNVKFDNVKNLDTDSPTYGSSTTAPEGATKAPGSAASTCSNVYCHSIGNLGTAGSNVFKTPTWNTAPLGCAGCHGDGSTKSHPVYANTGPNVNNSNSHVAHVEAASYACDMCHVTTTSDITIPPTTVIVGGGHINRVENVVFKTWGGMTGTYTASKQCNNTYCHGTTGPQWGAAAMNCGSCHPSMGAGGASVMAPAHNLHVNTTTGYYYSCAVCHDNDQASHPGGLANAGWNQAAEVKFESAQSLWATSQNYLGSPTAAYRLGKMTNNPFTNGVIAPVYVQGNANTTDASGMKYTTNGTCATVWCHSNANPVGGTNVYNTVAWNQANTGCNFCHSAGSESTSRTWSLTHDRHVKGYGTNSQFTCKACHAGTATSNTAIASGFGLTNHVNGTKDVVFSTFSNSAVAYNVTTDQCSTYCHSTGKNIAAANLTGAYSGNNYSTPTWSGSTSCNSCHGKNNPSGRPEYTSGGAALPDANSHEFFGQADSHGNAVCSSCHALTVDVTNTVIVNASVHVDGMINVSFGAGVPATWDSGTKTCSVTNCHGTSHSGTATWGGLGGCTTCHGQPPLINSMLSGSYTTGRNSFASNGTGQHYYHKVTKGYVCETCHNGGQSTGGNHNGSPRYLNIGFLVNGLTSGTYNAPALTNATIVNGGTTTYTLIGSTRICSNIYCHSDGGNYAMSSYVYQSANWDGASYTTACNQCHGNATRRAITTLHPIHENTYGYECSLCHRGTVSGTSTLVGNHVNFAKDVEFDANNGLSAAATWTKPGCTTSYCHSLGTKSSSYDAPNYTAQWNSTLPANCVGCHSGAAGASATMNTVTHLTHINNATAVGWNIGCKDCHMATVSSNTTVFAFGNHVNRLVNVKFDNVINLDTDTPTYNVNSTTVSAGSTKGPGSAVGTCSNVYCHSIGNLGTAGANVFRNVTWNTTNIGCTGCHGDGATKSHPVYANTGINVNNSNSHVAHINGASASYGCDVCHVTTTSDTSTQPTTVIAGGAHLNRVENVAFKTTGGVTGTYTAAGKTCNNTYCHGTSAQWGGSSVTCANCHDSNNALSLRHDIHYATATQATALSPVTNSHTGTGYVFGCGNCHPYSGAEHVKGPITANFRDADIGGTRLANAGYINSGVGTNAVDAKGFDYTNNGTCNNSYCHSTGNVYGGGISYNSPTWGGADTGNNCNVCHRDATAIATNKHAIHIADGTYNYRCQECHNDTVTADGTIDTAGKMANHINGTNNVVWNSTGVNAGGTAYGQPNCTIYCHSLGTTGGYTAPNTAATWSGTLPTNCAGCHDNNVASASIMDTGVHTVHVASATSVGRNIGCQECHMATVSDDRTVNGFANHVNRLVNVKFDNNINLNTDSPTYNVNSTTAAAGSTKGSGSAVANCNNVFCHSIGNLGGGGANVFKSVAWSGTLSGCSACHGNGTDRSHPVYANTGANVDNSNSHVAHVEAALYACDMCHVTTTVDTSAYPTLPTSVIINGAHLNRVENVVFKTWGGMTGTYTASKQCNNTYCHGTTGPQWGAAAMNCGNCHPSMGSGGASVMAPAHNLHVNTTTGYYYSCAVCHDDSQTTHPGGLANAGWNQAAEVKFEDAGATWTTNSYRGSATNTYRGIQMDYNLFNSGAATPTYVQGNANTTDASGTKYTTNGTCSNVWCHSNAAPAGGTNVYNTVTWNQANTGCNFCHSAGSESTSRTWSVKHDKHIKTYGANADITCKACHAGTAASNTAIASGYGFANHVNGAKDVVFSAFVNSGGATWNQGGLLCGNTYCHSRGTSFSSYTHASLAWDAAAQNCDTCHGTLQVANEVDGYGMPDYSSGSPKANSHWQHVENGSNCKNCHGNTVTSMSQSNTISGFNLHMNKTYDLVAAGNFPGVGSANVVSFTVAVQGTDVTPTQCSNVSCHSGSNATWGVNASCQSCHAYNQVDKDDFEYLDGTKAVINATVWNSLGHGSISAYPSGNAGANFNSVGANMCLYCHNDSAPHSNSTNFFRLKDIANATYGANGSCMACHASGSAGVTVSAVNKNSTRKVGSRHYGSSDHTTSRTGGQFCWDCHDPHGDKNKNNTNNWYMIHNRPFEVSNATTMKPMTLTVNSVVFTAATTGTDYANNSTYDGVCNVCHVSTNHYWKGAGSAGGDTHRSTEKCTSCHAHTKASDWDSGFAGGGESSGGQDCATCHADLYNRMHDGTPSMMYKHFMNSDTAAYYPIVNQPAANSTAKTCLMCHVDHGIFSGNAGNATRGDNLRKSSNINSITTTTGFTNSDYDSTTGGVCYSCHFRAQTKTLTTNNGVVNIPPVPLINSGTIANVLAVAETSTHIYSINSGAFTDGSVFLGVCVKCHDDTVDIDEAGAKSDKGAQSVNPRFGMHQGGRDTFFGVMGADNPSLESVVTGKITGITSNTVTLDRNIFNSFNGFALVITKADGTQSQRKIIGSSNPATDQVTIKTGESWLFTPAADMYFEIIKNISPPDEICLQCHSLQVDGYKPTANKDFYNAVSMSSNLESILNSMFADKGKVRTATSANATSVVICTDNAWVNNTLKMYSLEIGGYRGLVKTTPSNAAADTTCSGTYGQANAFTLGGLVPAIPSAVPAGTKYTLYKFTHPLDKYGRHDMDEGSSAPLTNSVFTNDAIANSSAWASGDMGDCNTGVTATVCGDTNKVWPINGFKNLYATFTSGQCSGKSYTIASNNATSFTLSSTTVGCAGGSTQIAAGDAYYIGTRHVSCNDCHNPHAAQKKPGGVGSSVSFPNTTSLKDTARKLADTGWATNKWNGYLLVVTGKNGTNDNMFRQVRQITTSTTDATGTTYGFGLPMTWVDATSWTYEVLRLNGESGPGARGTWGVKVSNFNTPTLGTLQNPSTVRYTKVYDTADPGSTGKQYELCLKCHSYYGFGKAYPTLLSGGPNNTNAAATDLAVEFNTNNLAHHAVFGIGKNQPLPSNGVKKLGDAGVASRLSASWSNIAGTGTIGGQGWVSGFSLATNANTVLPGWYAKMSSPNANVWYQIVMVNTTTSFRIAATDGNPWGTVTSYPTTGTITVITPGLGDSFVPPYGPWAIIRCTECHGSKLSDPLGPHASTNKWLIKDGENTLKFQWRNAAGALTKITYGTGNNTFSTAYFCFNCHRADVYGTMMTGLTSADNATLSRVAHGGSNLYDACGTDARILSTGFAEKIWGQYCRTCHMGDKIGAAHGTNAMNVSTTAGYNKQGRRFLNGATWSSNAGAGYAGLKLGTTSTQGSCYVSELDTNVDACAQGHSVEVGQGTTATYNYDAP